MESKLIKIKKVHPVKNEIFNGAGKIIFVGDTHGDLEASQKVVKEYLLARRSLGEGGKPGNKIVFLGDYVDRGPYSKENLDFLLKAKGENPNQIFLLQGNHEGHHILRFSPADFWESLNESEYKKYCLIVEKFPLAIDLNFYPPGEKVKSRNFNGIVALHGVLPDVKSLEEINQIKSGDEEWMQITWGDFSDEAGEYLGINSFSGRPQFGRDYFFKLMGRFNKKILIRSHQPDCPQFMFNDRCLTIFTSSAYTRERTIAIANLKKEIKSAKDLEIKRI